MSDHYADVREQRLTLEQAKEFTKVQPTPIKSDGGSTAYYELRVPDRVLNKLRAGENTMETGDVIEMLVDNDFDMGNIIKALRRINQAKKGAGKAGVGINYDIKKCHYFLEQVEIKAGL